MTDSVLNWTSEDAMREWCRVNPGCDAHPRGSGAYPPSLYALDYARAVEAATLAKLGVRWAVDSMHGTEPPFRVIGVPEAEARERERKAWDAAIACFGNASGRLYDSRKFYPDRDLAYPSLLPKTPPPLKLSTGTWTRVLPKEQNLRGPWNFDAGTHGGAGYETPLIATAADADALAAWLRQHGEGR